MRQLHIRIPLNKNTDIPNAHKRDTVDFEYNDASLASDVIHTNIENQQVGGLAWIESVYVTDLRNLDKLGSADVLGPKPDARYVVRLNSKGGKRGSRL